MKTVWHFHFHENHTTVCKAQQTVETEQIYMFMKIVVYKVTRMIAGSADDRVVLTALLGLRCVKDAGVG